MLDRIHVELIHFFPSWDLMTSTKPKKSSEDGIHSGNGKSNNHRNNGDFLPTRGYKARSSIVTSMFGGTLQNEVGFRLPLFYGSETTIVTIMVFDFN